MTQTTPTVIQRHPGEYIPNSEGISFEVTPQMRISIVTIIRDYMENCLNEQFIVKMINDAIHSRDEIIYRASNDYVKERMAQAEDKGFLKKLADYVADLNIQTERRIKAMEDTVVDLRRHGMPDFYVQLIHNLDRQVQSGKEEVQKAVNRINILIETKFVEEVTNEELKMLYVESGLALKNVAEKFGCQFSYAGKMINGKVAEPKKRHQLKVYLKEVIEKKALANAYV